MGWACLQPVWVPAAMRFLAEPLRIPSSSCNGAFKFRIDPRRDVDGEPIYTLKCIRRYDYDQVSRCKAPSRWQPRTRGSHCYFTLKLC